jgi:exodeoxyribonuclease X
MQNYLFFDTETTGNTEKDVLCQIAYKMSGTEFSALYKPSIAIPPEASAVHHITNKMVADKPEFKSSKDYGQIKLIFESADNISVAHNAKFDIDMFKKEGIAIPRFICTLRLARHLDKEGKIPRYNLQYLRYYLGIEIDAQAHDALGDVKVLEALFERLIAKMVTEVGEGKALEEMLAVSARPSLMRTFTFGKHNEKNIADVAKIDRGYLEWLLAQKMQNENDEEDWIYTLKHYLGKE